MYNEQSMLQGPTDIKTSIHEDPGDILASFGEPEGGGGAKHTI